MQEKAIFEARLNKNIKIILNKVLGPLVFLLLFYSVWREVIRQPDWRGSLDRIGRVVINLRQWKLWAVILLMPLNWGIEARKWQVAMRSVGGIRYRDALKAVFTGTTFGSFTPNRIGEYMGRMLYVEEGKRLSSIPLTIVCSIAQLLITLLAGFVGMLFLRHHLRHQALPGQPDWDLWIIVVLGMVFVLLVSLTFIYFRLSLLMGILGRIPRLRKFMEGMKMPEDGDAIILLRILSLSFFRYLVFIAQYALIFPVFGVYMGIVRTGAAMSVVFLVMAVVPTFTFLTELGLRWGASIEVLEWFGAGAVGVLAASLTIWIINLIIPALIGSLLILGIKLFKR